MLARLVDRLGVLRRGDRGSSRRSCRGASGASRPRGSRSNDEPYSTSAPLAAVPPDEVRDVVDVRVRARRDRGETDGRQRRERRDRPAVGARSGECRERRRGTVADRVLEGRRRQAVDDDQDRRGLTSASVRSPAYFSPARCRDRNLDDGDRDRLDEADDRDEGERESEHRGAHEDGGRSPTVPPRLTAPRANVPAPKPLSAPATAPTTPAFQSNTSQPITPPATRATAAGEKRRAGRARERSRRGETERDADPRGDADQPELVHEVRSVVSCAREAGRTSEWSPPLPMLVFFTRSTSGPARRMESLLAHVPAEGARSPAGTSRRCGRASAAARKFAVDGGPVARARDRPEGRRADRRPREHAPDRRSCRGSICPRSSPFEAREPSQRQFRR